MGVISWILLGGISGWLANKFFGGEKLGAFGNIVVGMIGAMLGGVILNLIGGPGVTGLNLYSIFVSVLGSWILLYLINMLKKN